MTRRYVFWGTPGTDSWQGADFVPSIQFSVNAPGYLMFSQKPCQWFRGNFFSLLEGALYRVARVVL